MPLFCGKSGILGGEEGTPRGQKTALGRAAGGAAPARYVRRTKKAHLPLTSYSPGLSKR